MFHFPLVLVLVRNVCCLRGGGCVGADALVVPKSGSSSVLAEGKPESCGKTPPARMAGVTAALIHPARLGVKLSLDVCWYHSKAAPQWASAMPHLAGFRGEFMHTTLTCAKHITTNIILKEGKMLDIGYYVVLTHFFDLFNYFDIEPRHYLLS